jgi:hypothetical protein
VHDLLGPRGRLLAQGIVLSERRRARLLEEQVLAGAQDLQPQAPVVDRPRR